MTKRKSVLLIVVGALCLNVLFVGAIVVAHHIVAQSGAFETAELAIRSDSAVSQIVGDVSSVTLAYFNFSMSVSGPDGAASLKTHVVGSHARADAYVALQRQLGEWKVVKLRVVQPGS